MTTIQPTEPPPMARIPEKNALKTFIAGLLTMIAVIAAPVIVGAAGGNYWVRVLDFAMLYVMPALGLNVVVALRACWIWVTSRSMHWVPTPRHCCPRRTCRHSSNGSRISRRADCTSASG